MKPLDVAGILERAGADASAPEGSQAWALAQVGDAVAELIAAADHMVKSSTLMTPQSDRLRTALARFEATP